MSTSYRVRRYLSDPLNIYVGKRYRAEGFSGLADGVSVTGELTEIDRRLGYATIFSDEFDMPCAVRFNSIYELDEDQSRAKTNEK